MQQGQGLARQETVVNEEGLFDREFVESQEALGIPGEATCPIGTLGQPPHTGDRRSALRSDAVRLFVERARAVLPAFELTDELTPMVVRICTRLDGLPLALELAARWLRTISPDRLLAVLDGGGLVDAPSSAELRRDTSIRASVAWSHALATPAERVVLRRLSVFSGAFDSDAASAVCGEDAEQAKRRSGLRGDIALAARFVDLLRG